MFLAGEGRGPAEEVAVAEVAQFNSGSTCFSSCEAISKKLFRISNRNLLKKRIMNLQAKRSPKKEVESEFVVSLYYHRNENQ